MKKKLKKQWIKALKSGDYTQGYGQLCDIDNNTHCCLGVLCEVAILEKHNIKRTKEGFYSLNKQDSVYNRLNDAMLSHFSLAKEDQGFLIILNDERKRSFKKIAKWIEKHL
jgi:hypothetical protein